MIDPAVELLVAQGPLAEVRLLAPMQRRSASEQIAERLVTAIALGEFVPGQRLPTEREMAQMLSVSRATVREALQRLAASGYVEIRRGRGGGAFVQARWGPDAVEMIKHTLLPTWERLEHLFDLRALVEPLVARTAAERRGPDDVAAIRAALAAYRDAGDDRASSGAADGAFHRAVARASGNPYLESLSAWIRREITLGFGFEPYTRGARERALAQHPELAAAVVEGRPDRAATLARTHFTITEELLRELLARIQSGDVRPDADPGAGPAAPTPIEELP